MSMRSRCLSATVSRSSSVSLRSGLNTNAQMTISTAAAAPARKIKRSRSCKLANHAFIGGHSRS